MDSVPIIRIINAVTTMVRRSFFPFVNTHNTHGSFIICFSNIWFSVSFLYWVYKTRSTSISSIDEMFVSSVLVTKNKPITLFKTRYSCIYFVICLTFLTSIHFIYQCLSRRMDSFLFEVILWWDNNALCGFIEWCCM